MIPSTSSGAFFGITTMLAWGLWLVLADIASESIDPVTAAAISYVVAAIMAVSYALFSDASLAINARGGFYSIIAGVFAAVGLVATYIGLSLGSTATVSTIGALYFAVAAIIGIAVLGESVTLTKAAGVFLAVIALILITR